MLGTVGVHLVSTKDVCQITTLSRCGLGGSQVANVFWSSKQNGALRSVSTKKTWKVYTNHFPPRLEGKKARSSNSRKVPNKNLRLPKKKTSGAKVVLPSQCSWKHRWKHRQPLKLPSSQKKSKKKTSGYMLDTNMFISLSKNHVWKRWFPFSPGKVIVVKHCCFGSIGWIRLQHDVSFQGR